MSDVDATQPGGRVQVYQPGGEVSASQVGGTVGARLAQPQANLWTPAQLGSDLALWLDVWDSDFDLRTDGGTDYVERWGDLSGNENDAVQTTGSEQMRYLDDRVISDGGEWLDAPPPQVADQITMMVLVKKEKGEEGYLDISDGSSTNTGVLLFSDNNLSFRVVNTNDVQKTANSGIDVRNEYHILVGQYDGSQITVRVNGALKDTTALSGDVLATDDLQIGALGERLADRFYAAGGMSQSVITLSVAPVKKIEGWAAHKADRNGIPEPLDNLPSDHPYKDSPPTV